MDCLAECIEPPHSFNPYPFMTKYWCFENIVTNRIHRKQTTRQTIFLFTRFE